MRKSAVEESVQIQDSSKAVRPTLRGVVLALIVLLGGALTAFAWIVSSPSGGGPDDDQHQTSIWCPSPGSASCQIVGRGDAFGDPNHPMVMVPARVMQVACFVFRSEVSAACLNDVPADAGADSLAVNTGRYPGTYYRVMHIFATGSYAELDTMNLLVRSANAFIAALFFGVLAWLLPWSMKRLLAYVMVGFSVPLVIYFIASINPSAWAFIGVPAAWFAMTGLFATRFDGTARWRRRALAVVAVAGTLLAAAARTDAAAYCVVAVLAVGAMHLPDMRPAKWRGIRLIWATMLAVTVVGIIGTFSGSQTTGLVGMDGNSAGDLRLLLYNITALPQLISGFGAGQLGWLDVPMKPMTTVLSLMVAGGLLFGGLRRMSWTKTLAAGGVSFVLIAVPLFALQMSSYEVGQGVQQRYLVPPALILAGVVLSRRKRDGAPALSLTQTVISYVFLVLAQSWALHELIRRYVVGTDGPELDLNKQIEWWRAGIPSPNAVWLIGSVGFALLAMVLFLVRRRAAVGGHR